MEILVGEKNKTRWIHLRLERNSEETPRSKKQAKKANFDKVRRKTGRIHLSRGNETSEEIAPTSLLALTTILWKNNFQARDQMREIDSLQPMQKTTTSSKLTQKNSKDNTTDTTQRIKETRDQPILKMTSWTVRWDPLWEMMAQDNQRGKTDNHKETHQKHQGVLMGLEIILDRLLKNRHQETKEFHRKIRLIERSKTCTLKHWSRRKPKVRNKKQKQQVLADVYVVDVENDLFINNCCVGF